MMYLNLASDLFRIYPHEGVVRQISSYDRRSKKLPGLPGEFQRKCVTLGAGEEFAMADIDGPGMITRIWVTLPWRYHPGCLRNLILSVFWDNEEDPSVLSPLGDFFGATFDRPVSYYSAYNSITSGAFLAFFPMPFRERALIKVKNDSPLKVRLFFYQVTYLELRKTRDLSAPYFHCRWVKKDMKRGDEPFTILQTSGRGFYLGCHLNMTGRGYPWRLNPIKWQMPEGFGLGMLEGWERIWIDGSEEPNVHGTGGEDYFNGAWYFTDVPCTCLTHGVTLRSYLTRRVSCYRFHAEMPVWFESGVRITLDHGLINSLPAVYDGSAYWYQFEPHPRFGDLPPGSERRHAGKYANFLTMLAPLGYALAALKAANALKGRFKRPDRF